MATTLQFFRAMAIALTGDFAGTIRCRNFCAELDSELDSELGGTFEEGCRWSTSLQRISGVAAGVCLCVCVCVCVSVSVSVSVCRAVRSPTHFLVPS